MSLELYTFTDSEGCEQTYSTMNAREAKETAEQNGWCCIANQFEFTDSEVVWDFTGAEDYARCLREETPA